jgi:uncharacterized membrane protein
MPPLRRLFGPMFVTAGVLHFATPEPFESIVPDALPAPAALVRLSGVFEIVAGAATMHPRTRRPGRLLSVATLLGVFPSNVHMALHPERYPVPGGRATLLARLPLQGLLVLWALRAE